MDIKERNYIIYQFAGEYLRKNAYGLTESILEEYFYNPRKKELDEAFGVVISSAVDWHKPKARSIAYWDKNRSAVIEKIVGNHSISYVLDTFNNSSMLRIPMKPLYPKLTFRRSRNCLQYRLQNSIGNQKESIY